MVICYFLLNSVADLSLQSFLFTCMLLSLVHVFKITYYVHMYVPLKTDHFM